MGKQLTIKISRDLGIVIVLGILITMSIINKNEFAAAITFMYVPVGITLLYYLFLINYPKQVKTHHVLLLLIFLVSSLSTFLYYDGQGTIASPIIASFIWIFMCTLLTSVKYDPKTIVRIINVYTLIAVLLSINTLYAVASGMVSGKSFRVITTIFGVRKDNNFYASFLTPIFAYGFYRFVNVSKNRLTFLAVSALVFAAIFFTGSRASFISMLLIVSAILAEFIFRSGISVKKVFVLMLILCAIVVGYSYISTNSLFERLTDTSDYASDIRVKLWREPFRGFQKHPILGAGRGAANRYAYSAIGNYVHNTFLEILCDQGIVGAALFGVLFIRFFKVKAKNIVFMLAMSVGFFLPLLFVSAYQSCGFWLAISFCIILSEFLAKNSIQDLFDATKSV